MLKINGYEYYNSYQINTSVINLIMKNNKIDATISNPISSNSFKALASCGDIFPDNKLSLSMELNKSMKKQTGINNSDTAKRLIDYKKKAQEKLEFQIFLKKQHEEETIKEKPLISRGSQKLIEQIGHQPIYTIKRIKEIEEENSKKIEKLRQKLQDEKDKEQQFTTKSAQIMDSKLCFDPKNIKPMVYKTTIKFNECTEDEELKLCSFKPTTDKHSDRILSKDIYKKPVIERLIDYGKCKEKDLKQKIEESIPAFTPQGQKKTKKPKKKFNKPKQKKHKELTESKTTMESFISSVLDQLGKANVSMNDQSETLANTYILSKYKL